MRELAVISPSGKRYSSSIIHCDKQHVIMQRIDGFRENDPVTIELADRTTASATIIQIDAEQIKVRFEVVLSDLDPLIATAA